MNLAEIQTIVREVKFMDWNFVVALDGERMYLQLHWHAVCSKLNRVLQQKSRKWFLSPHMTESEVVGTCMKAVLTAIEHEARESFYWRSKAIFGPHISIHALHAVCDTEDTRH